MAILGDGVANHFEFQIYRYKWRQFRSDEGNTNLNKFFHCDENVEIYREMRLGSVPCIGCSLSCFGVLCATTVDWQMIQRYLRHLSFYSAPSCLNGNRTSLPKTDPTVVANRSQPDKTQLQRYKPVHAYQELTSPCFWPLVTLERGLVDFRLRRFMVGRMLWWLG